MGHNSNKVADALNYLRAGTNALEADIYSVNWTYYIGEETTRTDLSLANYVQELSLSLSANADLVPCLTMLDTKNSIKL